MSARRRVESVPPMQEFIDALMADCRAELAVPVHGITSDGRVVPGVFTTGRGAVDTDPLREAAVAFLAALDPADRPRASFPLDATERRQWFNVHPNLFRHGVMLDGLTAQQRELGLELLRATLSARGFAQSRDIMRLNGLLVTLTGSADQYGEWPYFVSIFGTPSVDEPWGVAARWPPPERQLLRARQRDRGDPHVYGIRAVQGDLGPLGGHRGVRPRAASGYRPDPLARCHPARRRGTVPVDHAGYVAPSPGALDRWSDAGRRVQGQRGAPLSRHPGRRADRRPACAAQGGRRYLPGLGTRRSRRRAQHRSRRPP